MIQLLHRGPSSMPVSALYTAHDPLQTAHQPLRDIPHPTSAVTDIRRLSGGGRGGVRAVGVSAGPGTYTGPTRGGTTGQQTYPAVVASTAAPTAPAVNGQCLEIAHWLEATPTRVRDRHYGTHTPPLSGRSQVILNKTENEPMLGLGSQQHQYQRQQQKQQQPEHFPPHQQHQQQPQEQVVKLEPITAQQAGLTGYEQGHQNSSAVGHISRQQQQQAIINAHRGVSRPASPTKKDSSNAQKLSTAVYEDSTESEGNGSSSNETGQIVSYLQIPASINDSKGSLSEFAAQITCFIWFESSLTLHRVEETRNSNNMQISPLAKQSKAPIAFIKWVTTLLSTTQVSQNVILLALLFIYRLKRLNPGVKGRVGSEYRLLTVALMLGNKFLDDNTYTNKTWADVSGIHFSEVHEMETEFLSNMKYNLFTSESEWDQWHHKLGRFWDYFDKASRAPMELRPANLPTPFMQTPPVSMMSPTTQYSSPQFLPNGSARASFSVEANRPVHPMSIATPPYSINNPSPVPKLPETEPYSRKRSFDDSSDEPYAKRVMRSSNTPVRKEYTPSSLSDMSSTASDVNAPRLPMPQASITPLSNMGAYAAHAAPPPSVQQQVRHQLPPQHTSFLPPPPGRAMATVYGSGGHSRTQSSGSDLRTPTTTSQATSPSGLRIPPISDHQRHYPSASASRSSSPPNLHQQQHAPPPPQPQELMFSPSGIAFQRNSPYRPVRGVNTLLVPPPPTASLQNPLQNMSGALHYQPLSKRPSEPRRGVVPTMHQYYVGPQATQGQHLMRSPWQQQQHQLQPDGRFYQP